MEKTTTPLEPVIETIDNLLAFYQQDCQRWLYDTRARLEEPEAQDMEELTPSSPLVDIKPEPEDGTISQSSTLPPKQSIRRRSKLQAELKSARLIRPAPRPSTDTGESSYAPRNILDLYQEIMKSRMHSVARTRKLVNRAQLSGIERWSRAFYRGEVIFTSPRLDASRKIIGPCRIDSESE